MRILKFSCSYAYRYNLHLIFVKVQLLLCEQLGSYFIVWHTCAILINVELL